MKIIIGLFSAIYFTGLFFSSVFLGTNSSTNVRIMVSSSDDTEPRTLFHSSESSEPRPMVGIVTGTVSEAVATHLSLDREGVLIVEDVLPGLPAEQATHEARSHPFLRW